MTENNNPSSANETKITKSDWLDGLGILIRSLLAIIYWARKLEQKLKENA